MVEDACGMIARLANKNHRNNDFCRCDPCLDDLTKGCLTPETCTLYMGNQILKLETNWRLGAERQSNNNKNIPSNPKILIYTNNKKVKRIKDMREDKGDDWLNMV